MTRTSRKTGRRQSVLGSIALLLLASGMLRIGAFAATAQALGSDPPGASPAATTTPLPGDVSALLEAFRSREARIDARESQVTEREDALARASAEVEDRLTALQEAEQSLAAMIAMADSAASDDLRRLTAVYESMRPQEAASLFEGMDPSFSAGFLGMMEPAAADAIMGRLTPETAYSISAVLAGRNSSAPGH